MKNTPEKGLLLRFALLSLCVLTMTGIYIRALFDLSMSVKPVSTSTVTSAIPLAAKRGDILDCNGILLAGNRLAFSVGANRLWNRGDTSLKFRRLNEILGTDFEEVPADGVFAANITRDQAALIEQNRMLLSGVEVYSRYVRDYPLPLAAHTLGRVGPIWGEEYAELAQKGYALDAIIGRDGLERSFEDSLKGTDGLREVELDEAGRVIGVISESPAEDGLSVVLTIDAKLQSELEGLLAHTIEELETGMGGAAVAIDIKTGGIMAMASYPDYNVATFSRDYNELAADPRSPLFNRAISGLYAPGSVFKMLTAVAGLETGTITPQTIIEDKGIYTFYENSGYAPRCWLYRKNGTTHGELDVVGAIKHSCNYFFYETGRLTGITNIADYAGRFGLGSKTGIELIGEAAGVLASPGGRAERWYDGDTLGAAIGQSDHQFTPLQLAGYIATLAGGGVRYRPHIVRELRDSAGKSVWQSPVEIEDIIPISEKNLVAVLEGMREVTEDGTASLAFRDYPISVGGKTGSVQVAEDRPDNGVFAAFAPFDDPEVAIVIVAEGAGTGGVLGNIARGFFNACFGIEEGETGVENPQ